MIKNNSLEQRLSQLEKKLFALLNKEKMNQPALGPSLAEKNINATHVTTPLIKSTAPTTPIWSIARISGTTRATGSRARTASPRGRTRAPA